MSTGTDLQIDELQRTVREQADEIEGLGAHNRALATAAQRELEQLKQQHDAELARLREEWERQLTEAIDDRDQLEKERHEITAAWEKVLAKNRELHVRIRDLEGGLWRERQVARARSRRRELRNLNRALERYRLAAGGGPEHGRKLRARFKGAEARCARIIAAGIHVDAQEFLLAQADLDGAAAELAEYERA